MDYSKLRGRVREIFHTEKAFAHAMGLTPGTMSLKLSGKSRWSAAQLKKACWLLHIRDDEIDLYFFTVKV